MLADACTIATERKEAGLIGSKYFVNHPTLPLAEISCMINMDMIGRLRDFKLNIGGIGTATEWKDLVEAQNKALITATDTQNFTLQLTEDGFGPSDHASFYMKKVPVLFFFTGSHEDYHKPSDTADKINYEGERKIMTLVGNIVQAIDANPKIPTYAVAKSSGNEGRRSFAVTIGIMPGYSDSSDGLAVDAVRDDSPAAKAGLKAGDKIVKLAGKEVKNVQDYTAILGELKADEIYEVWVVRGTERLILKVKPAARKQ